MKKREASYVLVAAREQRVKLVGLWFVDVVGFI